MMKLEGVNITIQLLEQSDFNTEIKEVVQVINDPKEIYKVSKELLSMWDDEDEVRDDCYAYGYFAEVVFTFRNGAKLEEGVYGTYEEFVKRYKEVLRVLDVACDLEDLGVKFYFNNGWIIITERDWAFYIIFKEERATLEVCNKYYHFDKDCDNIAEQVVKILNI